MNSYKTVAGLKEIKYELARYERELNKPINWGQITYQNLTNRSNNNKDEETIQSINKKVREQLELHPTITGPLDASDVLNDLSEEDQIDFFSRYKQCQYLILKKWSGISLNVLREISITFSECLVELDLSNASFKTTHLDMLFVRTRNLATLKMNHCNSLDTPCMMSIVNLLHKSLIDFYVNSCNQLKTDALQWIGGAVGINSPYLSRLKTLDLGECPNVTDRGICAIAIGCKKLTFLNLQNCLELTDVSIMAITQANIHLHLLNLCNICKITNKSMRTIGQYCLSLVSFNISRCANITDKGLFAIANGCHNLQAINISGLKLITEESMLFLVNQCKSLLTMNITGCERITINGLYALISGLDYVEKGVSFMGFKPVDQHVEKKLQDQLNMIQEASGKRYRAQMIAQAKLVKEQEEAYLQRVNHASIVISTYMHRYKLRMRFYRMWRKRVELGCILLIQRVYRGSKGRYKATLAYEARAEFLSCSPYALLIQQHVRAYLSRIKNTFISKSIREMYIIRRNEAHNGVVVRIQCLARRYLATMYVISWRELCIRRQWNMKGAILVMQQIARRFISMMRLYKKRREKIAYLEARLNAGLRIKVFCIAGMKRYKSKLSGDSLRKFFREKWTMSIRIQQNYRGYKARELYRKIQIDLALKNYAVRDIQRIYRGTRVLHWRDMRLNVIAAFVLDRHYVERRSSITRTRSRYKQFVIENQRDSASEPDEDGDEADQWLKSKDHVRNIYYWQNFVSNQIVYDPPPDKLAHEKNLIGKRVKIFWVVQNIWYEGTITRYHKRKQRHRIEYDDGDHEWMNLLQECERVQVQQEEDGLWNMFVMYQSDAMVVEYDKREQKKTKQNFQMQAYNDAMQWKSFIDDITHEVMFLSKITGEIRPGVMDALQWVVQDDGIGFPCFYNMETGAIVYEDPRFIANADNDLEIQRRYVLQELRIAIYVCRDLLDKYTKAVSVGDWRQINRAMVDIRNCPKLIHLDSFLIRLKALYQVTSVVDKPIDAQIQEEINYAVWLSEQFALIVDRTEDHLRDKLDNKRILMDKLTEHSGKVLYCQYCKRETKRHFEFCPTCGKQQVLFLDNPV